MNEWSQWRPRADLNVEQIDDEVVILDRSSNEVHQLNPAASIVWEGIAADEDIDPLVLSEQLGEAYGVSPDSVGSDVEILLEQFRDLGLLDQDG